MPVEITLLGAPRVLRDGEPASFDTRKAIALLADLALAERPRSRDSLCGLLWPAHDPERARGALRRTLSTLRSAIGREWIETAGDTILLRSGEGLQTDVERFRALAGEAAPAEELERAVAVFAGEFLEGFSLRDSPEFDDWQMLEADGLRRELAGALARLVELFSARGDYERALPHAHRWLEVDPVHEPAHRQLIRLYALSGDRAAALAQYRECVRTLSQELGVAPLEETVALYEQVSQGALAPPTGRRPSTPRVKAATAAPGELPLVGRGTELEALVAAHAAASPDGGLAVIEGEAGIGKTRLAQELVARGRADGAIVLASRCHDDEAGLAYGPIVELLKEALREGELAESEELTPQRLGDASLLLPELAQLAKEVPASAPPSGPLAQVRLLEGIASVIGAACRGAQPGIVVVDDVHAADEATLDAISYLGLRLRGRPLLLVLAWRSEGVPPGHRLRRLAADLAREGRATIVSPARLDEEQVSELVREMRDGKPEAELERRVYLESEGLPLFVAEYLAALQAPEGPGESLPGEVRTLLGARLGSLSEVAHQVLGAAAVVGRSFELETAREASGRSDEEAVSALEELVAQGVVRELPGAEPAYDFSHEKLRALVYEQMTQARRRLLHARVAATLGRGRPRSEAAAVVASHLRLAGDEAGAAQQHHLAAEHAASLYAYADALEHLEAALALGYPDPALLHERAGDLRTLVGDYAGALAAYESAAAQGEPDRLATIEHRLGDVHQRRGEWERAEGRFLSALEAAPPSAGGLRARVNADLALAAHHTGQPQRAAALAREALALAEEAGDRHAQAQAHNMLGVLARSAGELDDAAAELDRSLELARELADEPAQAAALNNRALVQRDAGELDEALRLTEAALALAARYGDRHREAALENNIADLHHAAGRPEDAMAHLKRAVAIFSEVGADDATRLPEIWKLVSW